MSSITSLVDRERYPARSLVDPSPGQDRAEQALSFIESLAWVGVPCVKKPERGAALGEVVLRAAIVYPLMERHVCCAIAHPGQPPVRGLNNHPTQRPPSLRDPGDSVFDPGPKEERINEGPRFCLNRPLSENQRRLLPLSGVREALSSVSGSAHHAPDSKRAT